MEPHTVSVAATAAIAATAAAAAAAAAAAVAAAAAAAATAAVVIQCVCDYAQNVCDCAPFVEIVPTICMCHILLNSVAVAVAVQLATEMALNSKVGRLVVWLFGCHTFWKHQ